MDTTPNNDQPETPRRAAIVGGIAVAASLLVAFNPFKSADPSKQAEKKPGTIRMLGEDGKLMEVDASILATLEKRKISNEELQQWIKEK